jgi:hypothetical protein
MQVGDICKVIGIDSHTVPLLGNLFVITRIGTSNLITATCLKTGVSHHFFKRELEKIT